MEGGVLFLSTLEHLQTLYTGDYTQGATSMIPPGPEARKGIHKGGKLELVYCTHMGAAGVDLFPGGVYPPPPPPYSEGGIPSKNLLTVRQEHL